MSRMFYEGKEMRCKNCERTNQARYFNDHQLCGECSVILMPERYPPSIRGKFT